MNTNSSWLEQFAPTRAQHILGNENGVSRLNRWLAQWSTPEGRKRRRPCALLVGPHGCGKTLAAHLCASAAGYLVRELNASDNRTARHVTNLLEPFLGSAGTVDGRKACLLMDEVDLSTGDAIRCLVKLLNSSQKPVICTANNLSREVKSLSARSEVIRFWPPREKVVETFVANVARVVGVQMTVGFNPHGIARAAVGDMRQVMLMLQFGQYSFKDSGSAHLFASVRQILSGEMPSSNMRERVFMESQTILPHFLTYNALRLLGDTDLQAAISLTEIMAEDDLLVGAITRHRAYDQLLPLRASLIASIHGPLGERRGKRGAVLSEEVEYPTSLAAERRFLAVSRAQPQVTTAAMRANASIIGPLLRGLCERDVDLSSATAHEFGFSPKTAFVLQGYGTRSDPAVVNGLWQKFERALERYSEPPKRQRQGRGSRKNPPLPLPIPPPPIITTARRPPKPPKPEPEPVVEGKRKRREEAKRTTKKRSTKKKEEEEEKEGGGNILLYLMTTQKKK